MEEAIIVLEDKGEIRERKLDWNKNIHNQNYLDAGFEQVDQPDGFSQRDSNSYRSKEHRPMYSYYVNPLRSQRDSQANTERKMLQSKRSQSNEPISEINSNDEEKPTKDMT